MWAEVFGYGSYFKKDLQFNDIDLLIVHSDKDEASCRFAISVKNLLISKIANADVTMLSADEERDLGFMGCTKAVKLGKVESFCTEAHVDLIIGVIRKYR